jgi:hypothetical protein
MAWSEILIDLQVALVTSLAEDEARGAEEATAMALTSDT